MKVLVLEEKGKHTQLLGDILVDILKSKCGHSSALAGSVDDAMRELGNGNFGCVLIHHADFKAADLLRREHPNLKYAAYSGLAYLIERDPFCAFSTDMKKRYSLVVGLHISRGLIEMLQGL